MTFKLSAHEVMRGIKVDDDRILRLKPIGWVVAASTLEAFLAIAVILAAILLRSIWLVALPLLAVFAADAFKRSRVAVTASTTEIVIVNRWRKHSVPISDVADVTIEKVSWSFRAPAYLMTRSGPGREWLIGIVETATGSIQCDALVSSPRSDDTSDPTPAEMKVDVLRRWLASATTSGLDTT
ncbi:MAG: hypothetical protein AB7L84_09550 [Acidimicrobiia bacterium]